MQLLYEDLSNHQHYVNDGDIKDVLADFVDADSFDDYKSLYEYVTCNFDELCEKFHSELLEYYREDVQEEIEK